METLEEAKETIEIYKDVYFMLGTEKANKILSILTIIFTLSIPVTVISSFYEMNISIPGIIEAPPTFLGPYTSMIFVIIISLIPSSLMYWYFRRAGWMRFDYPKLSFCKDTIPNLTDWYQNNRRKKPELQQTINSQIVRW
jgi:CorA-like Mg2+ transporter protein